MTSVSRYVLLVLLLNSCTFVYDVPPVQQTQTPGRSPRIMGLPAPPDCGHLYNVGRHREWADCMGVGYK